MSEVRSPTTARLVLATTSRMILRPAQPPDKWLPSALTSLIKLPEREAEVVNSLGQLFDVGHPLIFNWLYIYMSWRNVALSLSRSDSDPEHDSLYLWLHPSPAPSHQLCNSTPGKGFIRFPHFVTASPFVCYYTIDCMYQLVCFVCMHLPLCSSLLQGGVSARQDPYKAFRNTGCSLRVSDAT
jgi:hypothetical protein